MKIQTITKSINIKINTGDYGNFDVYASATAELAPGEDASQAGSKLSEFVLDEVLEQKGALDDLDPSAYRYNRKK
jgi:hypothetical protein